MILVMKGVSTFDERHGGGAGVNHGSVDDLLSSVKIEIGVTVISEDEEIEEGKEESDDNRNDAVEMTNSSETVDTYPTSASTTTPPPTTILSILTVRGKQ